MYPELLASHNHGVLITADGLTTAEIQSASFDKQSTEALAQDNMGNTLHAEYFDDNITGTIETLFIDTSAVGIGDIVTIAGSADTETNGKYIVTSVNEQYSNTDYPRLSIGLKRFVVNAIPPSA